MRNIRLQFVILAMVFASFGIVQLGRALQDFHRNYFWTPTTRQESLEKGKDSFEIYVRGQLLNRRLQAGQLAPPMTGYKLRAFRLRARPLGRRGLGERQL